MVFLSWGLCHSSLLFCTSNLFAMSDNLSFDSKLQYICNHSFSCSQEMWKYKFELNVSWKIKIGKLNTYTHTHSQKSLRNNKIEWGFGDFLSFLWIHGFSNSRQGILGCHQSVNKYCCKLSQRTVKYSEPPVSYMITNFKTTKHQKNPPYLEF